VVVSPEADSLPGRGPEGSSSKYQFQIAQPPRVGGFATVRAAKLVGFDEPNQEQMPQLDLFNDQPVEEDSAPGTSKASYSNPKQRDFFAVKEVRIGDNEKKLRCLLQEHDILKDLKVRRGRENVVALQHACFTRTPELVVYLVVNPWAQETLGEFLLDSSTKVRPWSQIPRERLWAGLVKDCIRGLDCLHSHGIIHNDLKPHNILLAPTYSAPKGNIRPVITDFNISQREGHDHGQHVGSREFMAPELQVPLGATKQLRRVPTAQSDMWSLGCCLALILVYLHSGKDKMNWFWGKVREPDDPRQDRGLHNALNRQIMDNILDSEPLKKDHDPLRFFIEKLRVIVDKILHQQQPEASKASKALEDVKTLLSIPILSELQRLLQNDVQGLRDRFRREIQE
jgi:serine/threonine protein kinase